MGLNGARVVLREERVDDVLFLAGLRNDLETQAWPKALPPDYTEAMYHKRYEEREFSYDRDDGRFVITVKETNEVAGSISYVWLEPRWSASIGIMVAKKFWGTGIALDAQEVLLKFLFEQLGLRVVRIFTHSGNQAAVKLAQKSGFKISGQQRKSVFKDGRLHDNLFMDLLREEYYDQHPEISDHLPGLPESD
jgi:RimJ/RimL family protein N-acetyltransferase